MMAYNFNLFANTSNTFHLSFVCGLYNQAPSITLLLRYL